MIKVEPKVFLLYTQEETPEGVKQWLAHLDGLEVLDHMGENASENAIELAARRCYKSFRAGLNPNVKKVRSDSTKYFENILGSGHGSVLEHGHSIWAFEDVSRVFTHELVRNRAGLGFSQESLRYVRLEDLRFWIPPEIAENPEAAKVFQEIIEKCEWGQKKLAEIFDIDNMKNFNAKKQLTSAFRRVAPIGLGTGIMTSFNMRALRWVIQQRTSPHAEIEIRIVFNKVAEIALERWPLLFQDFTAEEQESGPPSWAPANSKV